jgi:Cell division protein CrgA
VPKSRVRKKSQYTPPQEKKTAADLAPRRWVAPVMVGLFLFGLIWIVAFYIAGDTLPIMKELGNWNLLVGFAFVGAGFGVATQWR